MSQNALVNRSLTTVRTELEFLQETGVLSQALYDKIVGVLPQKYNPNMEPIGVTALESNTNKSFSSTDQLSQSLNDTKISPPSEPPKREEVLSYGEVLYNYEPQERDDLRLRVGDKVAILEHLSESWWKGKLGSQVGVFPSNYVNIIDPNEKSKSNTSIDRPPPPPQYQASQSTPPAMPQYQQYPSYQQVPNQSYSPAPFPPVSTNYYPQPQQVQQQPQPVPQQEQSQHGGTLKKFGSKFGNAAIFGAGATLGGDLINSIF